MSLRWSVGCNLSGDEIVHHWETGLRTALGPDARRDPATFGSAPFFVDGEADPAAAAQPQDELFRDAPETLADYADGTAKTGGRVRVGVRPGSVIAPHIAASCETTEDGDGSPLAAGDGRVLTVPPLADLAGTPRLRVGRSTALVFDLSGNAASLLRTRGEGPSGAVLHAAGAGVRERRAPSAARVGAGRTRLKVRPTRAGRVRAWVTLSGVRSANTVRLRAR